MDLIELKGTLWCGTMKHRNNPEDGYIMLIGTKDIYDLLKPYFAKDIKITVSEPDEVVLVLPKKGAEEWLKALNSSSVLGAVHGFQYDKSVSDYGQNLTDQLRKQLGE